MKIHDPARHFHKGEVLQIAGLTASDDTRWDEQLQVLDVQRLQRGEPDSR